MHIMHVIDGLPLGGAERMLVDIANAYVGRGYRASACVTRTCLDLATSLDPRVDIHVLGRRRRFDLRPLRRFARIVRDQGVDLLQAHSRSTFSMLAMVKAMGALRVPVILQDHYGSIEKDRSVPGWFRVAKRFCLSHYVGVCPKLGTWAADAGVARDRIQVIGNALDLSRLENSRALDLREAFGLGERDRIGVVVSGIRHDKGIDVLLHALALRTLPASVKVLVVGGANDPEYFTHCRDLCRQLGLDGNVLFVGRRSDVPAIVKGADFALVPSRSESGPLVLIEYLANGLPFVSTSVGDVARQAAEAGLAGFVPPNDAAAFRDAMDALLGCPPSEWRERGAAGRLVAQDCFNIQKVLPRWLEVYKRVLSA